MYLIRHGESTGDIDDRFGGDYDDQLSEKGKRQAKELAEQLAGKGIEAIYASPRKRALETAKSIEAVLEVPLTVIDDLRERNNYGVLTGLTKTEAKEKYPIDFEKVAKDKTHHKVAGSENYAEIKERAERVFSDILQGGQKTIAVVSHGGIISTYVREVLTKGRNIKLGDCAILEITKDNGSYSLACFARAELQ